jgi:hypothetical protein
VSNDYLLLIVQCVGLKVYSQSVARSMDYVKVDGTCDCNIIGIIIS